MNLNILRPAFLVLLLPPLFLLLSFIFSLVAITSSDWAHRAEKNPADPTELIGYNHRAPFVKCEITGTHKISYLNGTTITTSEQPIPAPEGSNVTSSWDEHCTRKSNHRKLCEGVYFLGEDNIQFCQQLALAGDFLIAGTVLIAIAFFLSLAILAWTVTGVFRTGYIIIRNGSHPHSVPRHVRRWAVHNPRAYLGLALIVIAGCGAGAMAAAQTVGGNILVNLNWPQSVFYDPGDKGANVIALLGPWLGGTGIGFAGLSWLLAVLGTVIGGVAVWELPKVGVREEMDEWTAKRASTLGGSVLEIEAASAPRV
ncbi:hypothetical protein DFH27DRAFT_64039 [Peziza echinospora]|nr:hypothetical protein DFH27DRAFT_64039 [Peziza echinospora]